MDLERKYARNATHEDFPVNRLFAGVNAGARAGFLPSGADQKSAKNLSDLRLALSPGLGPGDPPDRSQGAPQTEASKSFENTSIFSTTSAAKPDSSPRGEGVLREQAAPQA
jgi:hypothetical protein